MIRFCEMVGLSVRDIRPRLSNRRVREVEDLTTLAENDPRHDWAGKTWEEMARENPLAAVMTTKEMRAEGGISEARLELFFAKGRKLFERYIQPFLKPGLVVDYGCGPGRVLRAVADAGLPCAGMDISSTMIELGRTLVPEADLHVLNDGRSALPDACASVVYSYAVVQHISRLDAYEAAFDEMCRVLAPGGVLLVQVACDDFQFGLASPGRTENHQTWYMHYPAKGEPYRYDQDNWGGVTIGNDRQVLMLEDRGLIFDEWRPHKSKASRVWWLQAHRPD